MSVEKEGQDFPDKSEYHSSYEIQKAGLSEEELEAIDKLNAKKTYPKGSLLRKEGEISDKSLYVLRGCVRQYIITDGEELTTFFYTEEASVYSSINACSKPSKSFLECTEECELSVTSLAQQADMYKRFPRFQKMCREASEKDLEMYQEIFSKYISSSPEERYLTIMRDRPTLLHRVPQYQLASYIGVKPESLSRIRKRLAEK